MLTLKATDVRGYIDSRRPIVKPATIDRELCLLSTAINSARREWDWDIPNPASGRKLKEPKGRTRWINRGAANALLRAAQAVKGAPHLVDFIRHGSA